MHGEARHRKRHYLVAVVVHGQHAEHVQGVSTLGEFAHRAGLQGLAATFRAVVAGRTRQTLHANHAVLKRQSGKARLNSITHDLTVIFLALSPTRDYISIN